MRLRSTTLILTIGVMLALMLGRWSAAQSGSTTTITAVNVQNTAATDVRLSFSFSSSLANSALRYQVKYGQTTSYGSSTVPATFDNTTGTQSLALNALTSSTTYHFTVQILNGSEVVASSADRTFTTAGTSGGSAQLIIERVRVDCVATSCNIYFATNQQATVEARWDTSSKNVFTDYPNGASEGTASDAYRSLHIPPTTPPGLTANTKYYYRLTATASGGASAVSGEMTFTTSANDVDHIFATGQCTSNTTPPVSVDIGSCLGSQYCSAGGLIDDCTKCGKVCEAGKTCRNGATGGYCAADTVLNGAPTQCNNSNCYSASGVFLSPAGAGCFSTWPRCNANTILKVRNDRGCNLWLSCATSIQTDGTSNGASENLCLNLGACNSLNSAGQCNHYLPLGQCNNDPLRFCNADTDCQGGGTCNSPDPDQPTKALQTLTYQTPNDVSKIANLSGNVVAGLDWAEQGGANVIQGNLPWQLMRQIGGNGQIKNGDLEFRAPEVTPWTPVPEGVTPEESLKVDFEDKDSGPNHVLIVEPVTQTTVSLRCSNAPTKSCTVASQVADCGTGNTCGDQNIDVTYSGAATDSFPASGSEYYYAEARIRGDGGTPVVRMQFGYNNYSTFSVGSVNTYVDVATSAAWQRVTLGPLKGMNGSTRLAFVCADKASCGKFQVDDVIVKPILQINTNPNYITPSCRLYPKSDSPSCDYADSNGVVYKGWKGYCLEHDSQTGTCLSWWPVDIIKGESSIFGSEKAAGYQDRAPLYFCAESTGASLPTNTTTHDDGYLKGMRSLLLSTGDCSPLNNDCRHIYTCGTSGFCGGSSGAFGTDVVAAPEDQLISEDGIYFIKLTELSADQNFPVGTRYITKNSTSTCPNYRGKPWSICVGGDVNTGSDQFVEFWFEFDPTTKKLTQIHYRAQDGNSDSGSFNAMAQFGMKESCSKIVQVVDQNGTASAFASRVASSVYKVPELDYGLATDLGPFGGALTPSENSNTPEAWGLLSAEQPNYTTLTAPGQARSGSPYACNGNCDTVVCTAMVSGASNFSCLTDGKIDPAKVRTCQQQDIDGDGNSDGECIGVVSSNKAASAKGQQAFASSLSCIVPSGTTQGYCGGQMICAAQTAASCSATKVTTGSGTTKLEALQDAGNSCGFTPTTTSEQNGTASGTDGKQVACNGSIGKCTGTNAVYTSFGATANPIYSCTKLVRDQCVSGAVGRVCQSNASISCTRDTDCPMVSVPATSGADCHNTRDNCSCTVTGTCRSGATYSRANVSPTSPTCTTDAECSNATSTNLFFAQERIKRLFTKSYGVWTDLRCSAGSSLNPGEACLTDSDCGTGACTVRSGSYKLMSNAGWEPPTKLCQPNPAYQSTSCQSTSQLCNGLLKVSGTSIDKTDTAESRQQALVAALNACGLDQIGASPLPISAGSVITGTPRNGGKIACNGANAECSTTPSSTALYTTFTLTNPCSYNKTIGYTCSGSCTSTASYTNASKPSVAVQSKYLRPAYVAGSQADYCAIPPQVTNVKFTVGTATTATITGGSGSIGIKFNTDADKEQVPLSAIRIDWGDNQDEFAFPYAPRNDVTKPHIFSHTYVVNRGNRKFCKTTNGRTTCEFTIKIQVVDSWGWCNDADATTKCHDTQEGNGDWITTNWENSGLKVIVQP